MPVVAHSVPVSPEDALITEKSARIRQWVKRRLEEVSHSFTVDVRVLDSAGDERRTGGRRSTQWSPISHSF